jgi:hypothetical protein
MEVNYICHEQYKDKNLYDILYYAIETINISVKMYFYIFYGLFKECVDIVGHSVELYFQTFQTIFLECLKEPQIYFIIVLAIAMLLTFYMSLRVILDLLWNGVDDFKR